MMASPNQAVLSERVLIDGFKIEKIGEISEKNQPNTSKKTET